MNVPFTIPSNPDLEKAFIKEAEKLNMVSRGAWPRELDCLSCNVSTQCVDVLAICARQSYQLVVQALLVCWSVLNRQV